MIGIYCFILLGLELVLLGGANPNNVGTLSFSLAQNAAPPPAQVTCTASINSFASCISFGIPSPSSSIFPAWLVGIGNSISQFLYLLGAVITIPISAVQLIVAYTAVWGPAFGFFNGILCFVMVVGFVRG